MCDGWPTQLGQRRLVRATVMARCHKPAESDLARGQRVTPTGGPSDGVLQFPRNIRDSDWETTSPASSPHRHGQRLPIVGWVGNCQGRH